MARRPAVFLDRDGTLNVQVVREGRPYAPERIEDFRLYDGVPEGCRQLKNAGYALVVATNQPDVGRGTVLQSEIEGMHAQLLEKIPEIDRVEVCYDPGRGETSLLDAANVLGIDLGSSWMVGDRWKDVECGKAAGVRTVLIDCGYDEGGNSIADHVVKTFQEAVAVILTSPRDP